MPSRNQRTNRRRKARSSSPTEDSFKPITLEVDFKLTPVVQTRFIPSKWEMERDYNKFVSTVLPENLEKKRLRSSENTVITHKNIGYFGCQLSSMDGVTFETFMEDDKLHERKTTVISPEKYTVTITDISNTRDRKFVSLSTKDFIFLKNATSPLPMPMGPRTPPPCPEVKGRIFSPKSPSDKSHKSKKQKKRISSEDNKRLGIRPSPQSNKSSQGEDTTSAETEEGWTTATKKKSSRNKRDTTVSRSGQTNGFTGTFQVKSHIAKRLAKLPGNIGMILEDNKIHFGKMPKNNFPTTTVTRFIHKNNKVSRSSFSPVNETVFRNGGMITYVWNKSMYRESFTPKGGDKVAGKVIKCNGVNKMAQFLS
ncbi:MAG: hypothetical protein JKX76_01470 [Colwellia sp.]|nr:hypothetical protein [Colwellia sp.]